MRISDWSSDVCSSDLPTTAVLASAYEQARAHPKRVIFAEAEEEVVLRAAISFREGGYGTPLLVGRDEPVRRSLERLGVNPADFEIHNARVSPGVPEMVERLYARLQRKGHLLRDCQRLVNNDRNVFGALMLDMGMGDAMITGVTRHFRQTMVQVKLVIDPAGGHVPFGIHMMVGQKHTVFIADTTVNERPTASELADIAEQTATVARAMGQEPRVAFLSYANFGNPPGKWLDTIRDAVRLLDMRGVGFEYEGEMTPDVALNRSEEHTSELQSLMRISYAVF